VLTITKTQQVEVPELEEALADIRVKLARLLDAVEGTPRVEFTIGPVAEQKEFL
jgi:hypothetical protein